MVIKVSKALGVKKVAIKANFVTLGILITGVLSIVLTLLTYYGSNSGNFIVVMDESDYRQGIMLSEDINFTDPKPILFADSIGGVTETTYTLLNLNNVVNTDGNYHDPDFTYLAYTFYMKNVGDLTVDIDYSLTITELHKAVDNAIRVLIIEDDTYQKIYQKPDVGETNYPKYTPETINFVDNKTIFQESVTEFAPTQVKKFSIVIWLEGTDPDCTDDILGGLIKTRLKFDIINS